MNHMDEKCQQMFNINTKLNIKVYSIRWLNTTIKIFPTDCGPSPTTFLTKRQAMHGRDWFV